MCKSSRAVFSTCLSIWGCSHFFPGVPGVVPPPSATTPSQWDACVECTSWLVSPGQDDVQRPFLGAGALIWMERVSAPHLPSHLQVSCDDGGRRPGPAEGGDSCGRHELFLSWGPCQSTEYPHSPPLLGQWHWGVEPVKWVDRQMDRLHVCCVCLLIRTYVLYVRHSAGCQSRSWQCDVAQAVRTGCDTVILCRLSQYVMTLRELPVPCQETTSLPTKENTLQWLHSKYTAHLGHRHTFYHITHAHTAHHTTRRALHTTLQDVHLTDLMHPTHPHTPHLTLYTSHFTHTTHTPHSPYRFVVHLWHMQKYRRGHDGSWNIQLKNCTIVSE